MSLSTIVETMDTQMIDFNEDSDIPMGMGGSADNWLLPVAHMDEDGLMQQENYSHAESLEVDMAEYEETAEYEMDEAAAVEQNEPHLVDAEVLDVSFHSSPVPRIPQDLTQIQSQGVVSLTVSAETAPSQPAEDQAQAAPIVLTQAGVEDGGATEATILPSSDGATIQEISVINSEGRQNVNGTSEIIRQEETHTEHTGSGPLQENSIAYNSVGVTEESHHAQAAIRNEESQTVPLVEPIIHSEVNDDVQHDAVYEAPTVNTEEPPVEHAVTVRATLTSVTAEEVKEALPTETDTSNLRHNEEQQTAQANEPHGEEFHAPEPTEGEGAHVQDYNEFSGEEQLDSPSILLKLSVRSSEGDQPDFVLFRLPDELQEGGQPPEEPLVLLQHHQELFYEPISAVFEAFRHEGYFSHLEELSSAEMLFSAPDLLLDVSEDNIYAREVSLHDLVAMHQGLGLPGHLSLTLQSVVPRFITRYNQLREQITRLTIGEGAHDQQETHQQESAVPSDPASHQVEAKEEHPMNDATKIDVSYEEGTEEQVEEPNSHAPQNVVEGADGEEQGGEEVGGVPAEETVEHAGIKDHDDAPYSNTDEYPDDEDSEEKGEDYRDELDADRIHDGNNAVHEEDREEERETEYFDEAAPEADDEGDEGYEGEEFEGGGASEGDVDNEFQEEEESEDTTSTEEAEGELEHAEPSDVKAHTLSLSSMTSQSASTEDSGQAGEELVVFAADELVEHTDDHSRGANEIANEEGKSVTDEDADAEGVEDDFGDEDFGDEDFVAEDGATEDTLEESPEAERGEGNAEEFDRTSQAILAESEKFVAELGADTDADTGADGTFPETSLLSSTSEDLLRTPVSEVAAPSNGKRKADVFVLVHKVHKNASKRSLDDAGFEETELVSPPSSPDSKRARK